MNKTCAKCSSPFVITEHELQFYEKVSPVFPSTSLTTGQGKKYTFPVPDICPDCRLKLRTAHRNEQYFYHTLSAVDGRPLLSVYSPNKPYKIYPREYWFSDHWDAIEYGRDFDFSRSFFEQFYELSKDVPRANMVTEQNENSEYTTGTGFCKNCYLINSSEYCEDCYYGKLLQNCKNIVDSSYIYDSEILYGCFNVRHGYNCQYVYNSQTVTDCFFCDNISKCNHCFLCTNLTTKEYCFENKQLTKEEYHKKIQEFEGYKGAQKALQRFNELRKQRIYKYSNIMNSENCTGDFIRNSKNCMDCYDVNDSEDCRYVHVGVKGKDLLDCCNMYINPELSYQVLGTIETFNIHFCLYVFNSSDMLYCENCYSCKNCFGCSGVRNKQYCVFNKQYTKKEYEALVPRIIEHMMKTPLLTPLPPLTGGEEKALLDTGEQISPPVTCPPGRKGDLGGYEWGQFFPAHLSPFGYNESVANDYFPLTKESAIQQGFYWNEYVSPPIEMKKKIPASKLPDSIKDIPDDILQWALICEKTQKIYKIIKQELQFYRTYNIPIPHFHPDVRYQERLLLRNPRKLWERNCFKCGEKMQTTYSPERAEIVYCEKCYLDSVY